MSSVTLLPPHDFDDVSWCCMSGYVQGLSSPTQRSLWALELHSAMSHNLLFTWFRPGMFQQGVGVDVLLKWGMHPLLRAESERWTFYWKLHNTWHVQRHFLLYHVFSFWSLFRVSFFAFGGIFSVRNSVEFFLSLRWIPDFTLHRSYDISHATRLCAVGSSHYSNIHNLENAHPLHFLHQIFHLHQAQHLQTPTNLNIPSDMQYTFWQRQRRRRANDQTHRCFKCISGNR